MHRFLVSKSQKGTHIEPLSIHQDSLPSLFILEFAQKGQRTKAEL